MIPRPLDTYFIVMFSAPKIMFTSNHLPTLSTEKLFYFVHLRYFITNGK